MAAKKNMGTGRRHINRALHVGASGFLFLVQVATRIPKYRNEWRRAGCKFKAPSGNYHLQEDNVHGDKSAERLGSEEKCQRN